MMQYLAYISIAFVAFQFVNVLLNFIFRQKMHKATMPFREQVSVLIPARNEEHSIGFLLDDLGQIKNNNLEIIVFDDQSTDNTASIVQKYAIKDNRIKMIESDGLPGGWLGKNHACYQLSQSAKGSYYLFVDADVRLYGSIIEDAVSFLKKRNLGLLSIFPIQIQETLGEKFAVPIMNYILLTLLPLFLVRFSPFTSHAAANGQFMLFNAFTYSKIQPHKLYKSSPVEDIAISRYFKKKNINIACLTGEERIKCRMYKSYKEATIGFTKNIFMFFGDQPVFAFLFWLFASFGFIPILISIPSYLVVYLITIIAIQLLYSLTSKQNILLNIILFPVHMVFLCQVLIKGSVLKTNKQYLWKGRNIYS